MGQESFQLQIAASSRSKHCRAPSNESSCGYTPTNTSPENSYLYRRTVFQAHCPLPSQSVVTMLERSIHGCHALGATQRFDGVPPGTCQARGQNEIHQGAPTTDTPTIDAHFHPTIPNSPGLVLHALVTWEFLLEGRRCLAPRRSSPSTELC